MKIKISFKKLEHYKGVIGGDIDYQYEKPVIYGHALKIELLKPKFMEVLESMVGLQK